ncbi:hypothetical protein BEN48_09395 [Hymenobacter glacialis]|uniref:Uncharacterized protein n=1 Tax=Hymenobacter glacialis TaxID=1908236 RepID=A0A1G1TCJ4_9BACT|nr:hypothetical protein BEN48_09395 [Hymenobacter glacialis]
MVLCLILDYKLKSTLGKSSHLINNVRGTQYFIDTQLDKWNCKKPRVFVFHNAFFAILKVLLEILFSETFIVIIMF